MDSDQRHIQLSKLPKEGKNFRYTDKVSSLGSDIEELIGKEKPYEVQVFIQPLNGGIYQATGFIKSQLQRVCSECGWDVDLDFYQKIQEILKESRVRESHQKKKTLKEDKNKVSYGNVDSEQYYKSVQEIVESSWNEYVFYEGVLDMTDLIREVIGFGEPVYPSCGDSQCEHKQETLKKMEELNFDSPFSVLKNLSK